MNRVLLTALGLAASSSVVDHGATTIKMSSARADYPLFAPRPGRGKGKTRSHDGGGTRAYQRMAQKKRNQTRNRSAHRG